MQIESETEIATQKAKARVENLIATPKAVIFTMVVSYNLWPDIGHRTADIGQPTTIAFHKMPSKVPTLSTWLLKCIQPKSKNCQTTIKKKS